MVYKLIADIMRMALDPEACPCGWGGFGAPWMGYGVYGGLLVILFWLIVSVIALVVAIYFAKWLSGLGDERRSALDVLNERYAKGEISDEEYERMKRNITRSD